MDTKNKKNIYKSFEQLQAELFPQMVRQEMTKEKKQDMERFGVGLANQSVDRILNKQVEG